MTDRPEMKVEHYLDAIALCRATLANDDAGLMAIVNSCNVGMTFQALVHLHLSTLMRMAKNNPVTVDHFLVQSLDQFANLEEA